MNKCCMFNNRFDLSDLEKVEPRLYRCKKCGSLFKSFKDQNNLLLIEVDDYLGQNYRNLPYVYFEKQQVKYIDGD